VAKKFPNGARILDIGAAAGEPSLTIAAKCPNAHVVSTDIAPENVEEGRKRAEAYGLPVGPTGRVEFRTVNAVDLSEFATGSFDAVVGTLVLMFCKHPGSDGEDIGPEKACSEIFRVLKPGGTLITTLWQEPPKVDVFFKGTVPLMKKLGGEGKLPKPPPGAPPPPNPFLLASSVPNGRLGDALKAAGFDPEKITAEEHAYANFTAGKDAADCALRFIQATPLGGMLAKVGGAELTEYAQNALGQIYVENGLKMVDLAEHCPRWAPQSDGKPSPDNPDGLTQALMFPVNTSLYVTAEKGSTTEDGKTYLEKHGVKEKLASAVTQALKERPADPMAFIAKLIESSGR